MIVEPKIHSHITDVLDEGHALAFTDVYCKACNAMLHARNNECMQTWVETGDGNYCFEDFAKLAEDVLAYRFGLASDPPR